MDQVWTRSRYRRIRDEENPHVALDEAPGRAGGERLEVGVIDRALSLSLATWRRCPCFAHGDLAALVALVVGRVIPPRISLGTASGPRPP